MLSFFSSIFGGVPAEPSARISSIFIYPIKSCRGISVPLARISSTGFYWDRQWMVVNSKGRAYTQRVEPTLALVEVEISKDVLVDGHEPTDHSFLELRAPGMDSLRLPFCRSIKAIDGVSVWEWSGPAVDEGDQAAEWFSKYLGKPSRLVRFNTECESRMVDPNYAQGYKTLFTDECPISLASQASLNAFNDLAEEPLPMNRFRANIIVDGCDPFSEDLWTVIKINNLTFYGIKLCSRCKVPNVDQDTATVDSEPNKTLKKFRSDQVLRPNKRQQGKVYFGTSLACKESLSPSDRGRIVKVGDLVYVVQKVSSAEEAAV